MFRKINTTIFNDQFTFAKVLRNNVFTLDTCVGICNVAYMQVRSISMLDGTWRALFLTRTARKLV